jgi:hypothetical protein
LTETVLSRHERQTDAAQWLGIGRPTFNKLLHQQIGSLTETTYRKLAARIPRARALALREAVASPATQQRLRDYQRWLVGALQEYGIQFRVGEAEELLDELLPAAGTARRTGRVVQFLGGPHGQTPKLDILFLTDLHPPYAKIIEAFREWVIKRLGAGMEAELRAKLSIARVLAPLARATGTVERTWQEMDRAGDLGPYLKAALDAERLLLKRERSVERAQHTLTPSGGG